MSDADPPDKIDDVPAPHDRVHISPDADAGGNLVAEHEAEHAEAKEARDEQQPPPDRRAVLAERGDAVGNPTEAAIVGNKRDALQLGRRFR